MTPEKLANHQKHWELATKARPAILQTIFPDYLTLRQRSVIENFVKERIQDERATTTSSS